jgi:hypothetical protein
MCSLENKFIDRIPGLILYKIYRDDILIVSGASKLELHSLLEDLNSLHESIKFTLELSDQELNFFGSHNAGKRALFGVQGPVYSYR